MKQVAARQFKVRIEDQNKFDKVHLIRLPAFLK
jgi:hypothetical protein